METNNRQPKSTFGLHYWKHTLTFLGFEPVCQDSLVYKREIERTSEKDAEVGFVNTMEFDIGSNKLSIGGQFVDDFYSCVLTIDSPTRLYSVLMCITMCEQGNED